MAGSEIELPTRERRSSRRRPDVALPTGEKIPPRSGLSRAEVLESQRGRIFDGLAAALAYHGYEDTKITDVVELAGVSRATFYEHFQGKGPCFAAAYEDGVERLSIAVRVAVEGEEDWEDRVSAGLTAGLQFLAASPMFSHLLLVEAMAAARPARLEHERTLERLAETLRPAATALTDGAQVSKETMRLLAGGLVSHLSARVLAGETERLPEDTDLLLRYLLTPFQMASADRRSAAQA